MDPRPSAPSLDLTDPAVVPYFVWDAAVTNAQIRTALREGSEVEREFWTARILTEARYADVWRYLTLHGDVLPRWERVRARLGRRRAFWEYLIDGWRADGLIP